MNLRKTREVLMDTYFDNLHLFMMTYQGLRDATKNYRSRLLVDRRTAPLLYLDYPNLQPDERSTLLNKY